MAKTKTQDQKQIFNDFHYWNENPFMWTDLFRLVCGARIGAGEYRAVYEFPAIRGTVVKVAGNPEHNVQEMNIWRAVKGTNYEKHFAPCVMISPCGHFLIQKKCRRITNKDKLPKMLPVVFTDIKKDNWGFIGKQLVCHDYQFIESAIDGNDY